MQLLSYFQLFWGGGIGMGMGVEAKCRKVGYKSFLNQKKYGIFLKQQKDSIVEQLSFD